MGRPERQNRALSTTFAPPPARVTLPSNLAGSLKYLDDAQLQRLLEAVTVEIDRRKQGTPKTETATAAATGASSQSQTGAFRDNKIRDIDQIPEGRANLIRASFKAGIKPAAIARTFHISQSLVSRVLSSGEKPKR
jgi:post-segregation antitoxin (ccd killing protein)